MQAQFHSWESALLSLAHEAKIPAKVSMPGSDRPSFCATHLDDAYAYCDAVTAEHSRSFYLASALLPMPKKRAVRALYAFCRVTDDLVDQANQDQLEQVAQLEHWRKRLALLSPPPDDLVAIAWTDARLTYGVPWCYVDQLIEGVRRDLHQTRYSTFDELAAYSYGVASTVGLMSMHIIGHSGFHAIPYAIKLGVALQVTNILRDVAEDWQKGRLYLPQEELNRFELEEQDIASGQVSDRWRRFMQFQIQRNRRLYQEAWPGIAMLNADGRFAIAAAAELYQGILDEIERNQYDVFSQRAHLSTWGKLRRLPRIWWRSRGMRSASA